MPLSQIFEVLPEHVKLLQNAVVRWEDCEFGAPAIDCKRPYGNTSVYQDMAEILEIPFDFTSWERLDESVYGKLNQLHRGTLQTLQIFISTGKMEAGIYKSENYGTVWTKVE